MKYHLATDGPEFRRMYALAAELRVPILIHFQEVDHFEKEGAWSPGFARSFERMLKAYPQTTFIGHADAFWANVSADYHNEAAYPSGPIGRGGITDKLLGDYPNLYGDLSANSGNNMLSRDPAFTTDFLRRHQNKLLFGSDCACTDGHGGGVSQGNNPGAARLAGKCVARETLTGTETVHVARDLPEDHLGQRSLAPEDSGVGDSRSRTVADAIVEAAGTAKSRLAPARIGYGRTNVDLNVNRDLFNSKLGWRQEPNRMARRTRRWPLSSFSARTTCRSPSI